MNYIYKATVVRWVDGDTVELDVDLGFKITLREKLRLAGINCPEVNSPDPSERERARKALELSSSLFPPGMALSVQSRKGGVDKYGRWLATIYLPDGTTLTDRLLSAGLGVVARDLPSL